MKKKMLLMMSTVIMGVTIVGCQATSSTDALSVESETLEFTQEEEQSLMEEDKAEPTKIEANQVEPTKMEEDKAEPTKIEENQNKSTIAETDELKNTELTFADLSKYKFEFSSGVGAWMEEFTIEKDGYFHGNYHDSDMGSIGEGYENGTVYASSYSGHFNELIKINDYTYKMKLADISYDNTTETEEIIDNTRYIYMESCCFGGNDTFMVYLPGTPLEQLSEEVIGWTAMCNQSQTELTMMVISNEANEYGIYSQERPEPLEEAKQMYESCKQSYEYYQKKLTEEAYTTMEMIEYSGMRYEVSDKCLNDIWNLIRYNVEPEQYDKILAEQRAWISAKEVKAKEISSEYEGGSMESVDKNEVLAELTMERCEELIKYLN
jgi:uncharacterized protein YecT (DUF1311 family)